MSDTIAGIVPLDDFITGIRADLIGEHDPSGLTLNRLLQTVERHIAQEADALDEYEHLARASGDAVVALVMRLILHDEERHHGLLMRIATTLRDGLNWTQSPSALPKTIGTEDASVAGDLATIARALIEEERTGAQALRRLAAQEKGLDSGLDSLLLEMMAMDSEKHAHLLRFVEKRLAARARETKRSHAGDQ